MKHVFSDFNFDDIKKVYTKRRTLERHKLTEALVEQGYKVMRMDLEEPAANPYHHKLGHGIKDYTSDGKMAEYDLQNWQWIAVEREGVHVTVSFQPSETDMNTGNTHTLFDRIGFLYENKISGQSPIWLITNIDLPLNQEKMAKVIEKLDLFYNDINEGKYD